MIVYLVAFFISLLFLLWARNYAIKKDRHGLKPSKFFLFVLAFLAFTPFFLISALRYDVGTDYMFRYVYDYQNLYYNGVAPEQEPFYHWFYNVIISNNINFQWFFVITGLLTNFFVFFAIMQDKNRDYPLMLFIYFAHCMFFSSLSNVRQCLGASCALASFAILFNWQRTKKTYFISFLLILLSVLFHNTSLIYIALYFLFLLRPKGRKFAYLAIAVAILSIPLTSIGISFLRNTSYSYFLNSYLDYGAGRIQLFFIIPELICFVLALYKILHLHDDSEYLAYPLVFACGAFFAYFISYFVKSNELFLRVYHIFSWFIILYLPYLLKSFRTVEKKIYIDEDNNSVIYLGHKKRVNVDYYANEYNKVVIFNDRVYASDSALTLEQFIYTVKQPQKAVIFLQKDVYNTLKIAFIIIGILMFVVQEIWKPLYDVMPYQTYDGISLLDKDILKEIVQ